MKRTLMILALIASALTAAAQYNPSAELLKKGGRLYQGDMKLTGEQIDNLLSSIHNDENVAYSRLWNKADAMRTSGIVLTSVGSAACVAGPFLYILGVAKVIGSGIGAGLSGNPDGIIGESELIGGIVTTCAGVAMLGTGIPLWCVGGSRMKDVVSEYNNQRLAGPSGPSVTLALGPCPNGIGLSLSF